MKRNIKIAMLIDGWTPVFGGGQIHVKELCKHLIQQQNCKVDLFVRSLIDSDGKKFDTNEALFNEKLHIYRIGPTAKFFNLFARVLCLVTTSYHLYKKAKKEKYDIIHAHAYVSGIPAKIVGKLCRIPVVYTVHGTMGLDVGKKGIMYMIENYLVNTLKYDLEISVSSQIKKYQNSNNIVVIPNGVDIESFDTFKKGSRKKGIHFLWVGRFNWQKGLEYLIDGITFCDKELLDEKGFHLHLVGDGELLEEMKKKVTQNTLEKYITFHGKIFGDELVKQYKKSDVFILPSLAEGQPLTVLEAFAAKLPVIASDVGDNKEFIDTNNGFLIEPGNAKELTKIIEKVLKTNTLSISSLGETGYDMVKKNYTWSIMGEKTREQYDLLINT